MSATPEQPTPTRPAPAELPSAPSASLPTAPALPESAPSETAGYQPLSMLALASLLLAGALALLVVAGTVIALWTRAPLLLPPWLLLVALAVVLMAWIARAQIDRAEGTLSGRAVADWAIWICLVLTPLYGAYYAATYFAVTAQAQDFGRSWLKLLIDRDVESAYWMTLPAGQRPAVNQRVRALLEIDHNRPDLGGTGPFTNFRNSELVHLLALGNKDNTQIDLVTFNNWDFEQGGYQVSATYQISNPLVKFQLQVSAQGITASTGEIRGRQWHILGSATHLLPGGLYEFSAEGRKFTQSTERAQRYLEKVLAFLAQQHPEDAFATALPSADREEILRTQDQVLGLGLAAGLLPIWDGASRRVLEARRPWFTGSLIDAETRFWAPRKSHDEIVALVRRTLAQGLPLFPPRANRWSLQARTIPTQIAREDGQQFLAFPFQIHMQPADEKAPAIVVAAEALVRVKPDAQGNLQPDSLARIELITGRPQSAQEGGGAGGR